MRLLVDRNLVTRVAARLRDAGHDAVHVSEGWRQPTTTRCSRSRPERVIVSEDTGFGALLARSGSPLPSLVLLRSADRLTTQARAELLIATIAESRPTSTPGRSSWSGARGCGFGRSR